MSVQAQVNIGQLVKEIEKVLCPKCKKKLKSLELPIVQRIRLKDLIEG